MKKAKSLIDEAFKQSFQLICERLELSPYEVSLLIQFVGRRIVLSVLKKDKFFKFISLDNLIGSKMIGIRVSVKEIQNMLRSIEFAFSDQPDREDQSNVSLIMYNSQIAKKPCIGIYIDQKAKKVLAVSDVMDALQIGNEQIN